MTTPCPTCRGIRTLVSRLCPQCGEQLLELPCSDQTAMRNANKIFEALAPVFKSEPATESFTTDQMLAAIDQWLKFGEHMHEEGHEQGYYSGSGWAARVLRAVRDFIEQQADATKG